MELSLSPLSVFLYLEREIAKGETISSGMFQKGIECDFAKKKQKNRADKPFCFSCTSRFYLEEPLK